MKETQIANFSVDCGASDFSPYNTILSPQGNWQAVSCGYEENQTLQIYSKTGKKWVVQFKDYVAKEFIRDGQTPMGTLYPVRWTNDELYLYFRSTLGISAGGKCFYGGWGQGLYRLKIENGTVVATLPPLRGGGLYIFSFSPSGRWLAYTRSVPTILDLRTGEEIYLQEGKNNIGDFAWSPEGSKLAYSTCQLSEDYSTERKSAIKIFSLKLVNR